MGKCKISQAWWYTPLISVLGDLSRWDQKLKASLRNREFQNSQDYARASVNLPPPSKKHTSTNKTDCVCECPTMGILKTVELYFSKWVRLGSAKFRAAVRSTVALVEDLDLVSSQYTA